MNPLDLRNCSICCASCAHLPSRLCSARAIAEARPGTRLKELVKFCGEFFQSRLRLNEPAAQPSCCRQFVLSVRIANLTCLGSHDFLPVIRLLVFFAANYSTPPNFTARGCFFSLLPWHPLPRCRPLLVGPDCFCPFSVFQPHFLAKQFSI